jgi:capsid protein
MQPIFKDWLRMALLTQMVELPISKFEKFNNVRWQPRGWQWVDPQNEVAANVDAIGNLLKTRTESAGERGQDFEEILERLAEEKVLIETYGLTIAEKSSSAKPPKEEDSQNGTQAKN